MANRAGLAIPGVVDKYDGLVTVFRALKTVKGVVHPFLLLVAVLQSRVVIAHTVQLSYVLIQVMVGVEKHILPVAGIISAIKALLRALIDNWNSA